MKGRLKVEHAFRQAFTARPKAAGRARKSCVVRATVLNSQPPEGGWRSRLLRLLPGRGFNSQPREGGWPIKASSGTPFSSVSTHSRTKAAGHGNAVSTKLKREFQLTAARRRLEISPACTSPSVGFQLTAARRRLGSPPHLSRAGVSTHSRPKAAGPRKCLKYFFR